MPIPRPGAGLLCKPLHSVKNTLGQAAGEDGAAVQYWGELRRPGERECQLWTPSVWGATVHPVQHASAAARREDAMRLFYRTACVRVKFGVWRGRAARSPLLHAKD